MYQINNELTSGMLQSTISNLQSFELSGYSSANIVTGNCPFTYFPARLRAVLYYAIRKACKAAAFMAG
jgi:hypothetical protein